MPPMTLFSQQASELSKPKVKTKAKQRYLKRKKERRKSRAQAASAVGKLEESVEPEDDKQDSEKGEEAKLEKKAKKPASAAERKPAKERRPKKRRKLSQENEDVEMEELEGLPRIDVEEFPPNPPSPPTQQDTSRPPSALPSFPLLALPDEPSQTELALQGLDQALIDAEIVDPNKVLPIPGEEEEDVITRLSRKTRKRLKELGITELFAVQTSLLPFLIPKDPVARGLYLPYNPPRDVCVSAPTGSGKTLAYVLPIIEILSTRIVTRLRALVVLPTRDLVTQVRETFEAVGKGRGLKIGIATGQHSFAHEQAQLVAEKSPRLLGGSSKIDILICTPGRLIDHLNGTPNFTLQHLRFLVIDEADRLLAQSFQDWLVQVLTATRPPKKVTQEAITEAEVRRSELFSPDALAPAFLHLLSIPDIPCSLTERKESSCQKLLFSATLTRDPGKIAALELRNPKYLVVQSTKQNADLPPVLDVVMERFTMPSTLSEHYVVCESSKKPLVFFHLVQAHNVVNALVFTKSAESTTRLVKLFEFFEKVRPSKDGGRRKIVSHAYSSDLPAGDRKLILEKFKAKEIDILICSDLISRGIDITHVSHVVSYDAPIDMRKYVHRVGRTARAGRNGDAWTLIEEQEARYFKSMMKAADRWEKVRRMKVGEKELGPLMPHYEAALSQLKDQYVRT